MPKFLANFLSSDFLTKIVEETDICRVRRPKDLIESISCIGITFISHTIPNPRFTLAPTVRNGAMVACGTRGRKPVR